MYTLIQAGHSKVVACMRTCVRACVRTCVCACMRTCVCACMRACMCECLILCVILRVDSVHGFMSVPVYGVFSTCNIHDIREKLMN